MSAVLDTVLGMAFLFFLIALFCSTAVETWANWIKKRAKFLLRGLDWMVGPAEAATTTTGTGPGRLTRAREFVVGKEGEWDERARAVGPSTPSAADPSPLHQGVMAVMAHPLVDALKTRNARGQKSRNPARIPTPTLATVLLDLHSAGASSGLDAGARQALTKLSELAGDSVDRLKALVEEWIDAQMQQVTEAYKRWTKRWLIVIASVVVLGVGIDSVAVMQALYTSEPLRNAVTSAIGAGTVCNPQPETEEPSDQPTAAEQTNECVRDAFEALDAGGVPLTWWSQPTEPSTAGDWVRKVVGLLLTIGAAVLGAPFWFDAISRISSLRNSGDPKK